MNVKTFTNKQLQLMIIAMEEYIEYLPKKPDTSTNKRYEKTLKWIKENHEQSNIILKMLEKAVDNN